ncbi:hypothetical protein WA556_003319 [Blastocystis sp. ATCC 50177/Nand II]
MPWLNELVALLKLVDSRFCDVLSKLRHSECFSHPVEYRLFLLCLLRDNLLPLPNRILALSLLNYDDKSSFDVRARFQFIPYDILDSTQNEEERWFCYMLCTNQLQSALRDLSATLILKNAELVMEKLPVTEDMKRTVETQKREYYRDQLSSPDVLPFMSLNSSSFVTDVYPHFFPELDAYLTVFEADRESVLNPSPSFSRPQLQFTPSREDMVFVPPPLQGSTFIVIPMEEQSKKDDSLAFERCCESTLDDEECHAIVNNHASFRQLLLLIGQGSHEKDKAEKLNRMMELNPLIGTALVEKLCTTKDQNVCVNLLRLLHLSVNSVNYASRLVMLRLLREEGVMQFIQDGLKEILEKQVNSAILSSFCFFIIGTFDRKLVDSSVIHDVLIDVKQRYSGESIVPYTIVHIYGCGDVQQK